MRPPCKNVAPMTLDAFRALCEADALLVAADAIDLITTVDRLEQKACAYGLIGAVGQDEVQQVMAAVFGSRR